MKKSLLIFAVLMSCCSQAFANENPLIFKSTDTTFEEIRINQDTHIKLHFKAGQVSVEYANGKSAVLEAIEDFMNDEAQIFINDFNFDGTSDIAVAVSYGYMGVNVFTNLYLYDTKSKTYKPSLKQISNPRPLLKTKELRTSMKSGPWHYTTLYRYHQGKAYKYRAWQEPPTEIGLFQHEFFDPQGKLVKRLVINEADEKKDLSALQPATRKVTAKKAFLYDKAGAEAPTKMYLVAGDEVALLEIKMVDYNHWYRVRYQGKKTINKWLSHTSLNPIND